MNRIKHSQHTLRRMNARVEERPAKQVPVKAVGLLPPT